MLSASLSLSSVPEPCVGDDEETGAGSLSPDELVVSEEPVSEDPEDPPEESPEDPEDWPPASVELPVSPEPLTGVAAGSGAADWGALRAKLCLPSCAMSGAMLAVVIGRVLALAAAAASVAAWAAA